MDSVGASSTLLLRAATEVEEEVREEPEAGVEVEMPVVVETLGEMVAAVGLPVEGSVEPEKTVSLFRSTRTSTCTVWDKISIRLHR